MTHPTKTVGVIGGLGPLATLDFFERVLRRTRTYKEEDHLRLIIDNNTKIPDRNAYGRGEGPSPAPALAASARVPIPVIVPPVRPMPVATLVTVPPPLEATV